MDPSKAPFVNYSTIPIDHDVESPGYHHYSVDYNVSKERAKKAISACISWAEMLIHLIAIAATVAIILVNALGAYWLDLGATRSDSGLSRMLSQSAQLKYIQFGVKLYELSAMASLSFILLHQFHKSLVKDGIPFGFLDAPYMIGAGGGLSVVFSSRFRTALRSSRSSYLLGFVFVLFTALTLTLGPSSAIAGIPYLSWWPIKSPYNGNDLKVYVRYIPASPWPTAEPEDGWLFRAGSSCFNDSFNEASIEPDCPGAGWDNIKDWIYGSLLTGSSTNVSLHEPMTNSQRQLMTRPLADEPGFEQQGDPNPSRRVSTAADALNVAVLGGFWNYVRNMNYGETPKVKVPVLESTDDTITYQPLVYSQCHSVVVNTTGLYNISFLDLEAPWHTDNRTSDLYIPQNYSIMQSLPPREPRFEWFSGGHASIGSVAVLPMELVNSTQPDGIQSSLLVACSFDARWISVSLHLEPRLSALVSSNITDLELFETKQIAEKFKDRESFRKSTSISDLVTLPGSWVPAVTYNITVDNRNLTTMEALLMDFTSITTRNNTHFRINMDEESVSFGTEEFKKYCRRAEELIGTATSVALVDGMARYSYMMFRPYLEIPAINSSHGTFDYIDLLTSNFTSQAQNASVVFANATKEEAIFFRFKASRYGYGFGFKSDEAGASVKFAISVLGIYLLVAFAYLLTIFGAKLTGRYTKSSSWEAVQSLVALAVNSQPSHHLEGAGAGVKNHETWKVSAKIRVQSDERLHLILGEHADHLGLERPVPDRHYK